MFKLRGKGWVWGLILVWLVGEAPGAAAGEAAQMEPVVVTASRFEEPAAQVPNRVVVVEPGPLTEARERDLGELLFGRSSFNVRSQGNPGSVQTISLRGSASNQVLVLVEGRPLNSVTTGGANLSELMSYLVERVEVVEGPHSHVWGSSAVGGVVNVVTRRPPEELEAAASAAFGSADTQLYNFAVGDTLGGLGVLLMGGIQRSDGFRPNSDLEAYSGAGKFSLRAGELDLSLLSYAYSDEIGVPGSKPGPGQAAPPGDTEVRNLTQRMRTDLINNTLTAETSPAEGLTLRARFFQDLRQLEDFGQDTYAPTVFARSTFDTLIFGGSLETELERGASRLASGVDWHHDAVEVAKWRTPEGGAAVAQPGFEESRTSVGVFVRERLQVTEPLALFLGARFDYDTTFGEEFSPDAGLTLTVGGTTLRGSVARVYRAPTFNELFWPDGGNPDLSPETGWGAEVGARREFLAGRLVADLSLFYWQIDNKIDWRMDPATFEFSSENLDEQETKGITLAVEAAPVEPLRLGATYTYLVANQQNTQMDWMLFEETTVRRRADLIPRHQVTAFLSYSFETGTRLYGRLLYESDRFSRYKPGEPLDDFVLLWAGASQRVGKNLELFFEAENLLDEDYSLQAGSPGDLGFPAPPLNFLGGLRVKY